MKVSELLNPGVVISDLKGNKKEEVINEFDAIIDLLVKQQK